MPSGTIHENTTPTANFDLQGGSHNPRFLNKEKFNLNKLLDMTACAAFQETYFMNQIFRSGAKTSAGRSFGSADQLYKDFLQNSLKPPSFQYVSSAVDPVKTPAPFPNIFTPSVTDDGYIDTYQKIPVEGKTSSKPFSIMCRKDVNYDGLATLS